MVSNPPLVSIVLLNWNGLGDTLLCLEYVKQLDYPRYEIIVVDNGSAPSEKIVLRGIDGIRLVDNPSNLGFTGGHIAGLEYASGEFILLLNNDAVIKRDYLQQAMQLFDDRKVAVVGGRSYYWNSTNAVKDESNDFYSYLEVNPFNGETAMLNSDKGIVREVNTVSGSAVIVRRSIIEEVGYLFEPFFAYYEETDLFARIKRAGYKVLYSPQLMIWHKNGASSGLGSGSSFFFYHILRNRFVFAYRNFDDEYLSYFIRDYVKKCLFAILDMPKGEVQKRYGKAYVRAALENNKQISALRKQRRELAKQFGNRSYCRQILLEQMNIILLSPVPSKLNGTDREGIKIIGDNTSIFESCDTLHGKNTWFLLGMDNSVQLDGIRAELVTHLIRQPEICSLASGKVVALRSSFVEEVGHYHPKFSTVGEEVAFLCQTSHILGRHYGNASRSAQMASALTVVASKKISQQIRKDRRKAKIHSVLSHIPIPKSLLLVLWWCITPKVPIRLKLARCRDIIIACLRFRKADLKLVLRHILNESTRSRE